MSDSSRQTPTPPPDEQASTGGWQTPQTGAVWRTSEQSEAAQGWSVPALPRDVPAETPPDGSWHLPKQDDTVFTPEDEIVINPADAPAPEDGSSLFSLAANADVEPRETGPIRSGSRGAAGAPEDALFSLASSASRDTSRTPSRPGSTAAAPEDILMMLERIEDEEDEEDTAFKSELFALTSLAQAEAENVEVVKGASSAQPVVPAPAEPSLDEEDSSQLSTVERAYRQSQTQPPDDAAAYARRQLEQLDLDEGDLGVTGGTPIPLAGTGVDDPGAYARRQLEQLGETPMPTGTAPMPVTGMTAARIDPRMEQLAQRYRQVEQEVSALRIMRNSGQISPADFEEQLRGMMIQDDDQVYWMVGAEGNTWYKYVNNEWVVDVPPALRMTSGTPGTSTIPMDSMAFSEDLPLTPARQSAYGASPVAEPFMPREGVPVTDPNMTQVGTGFLDDYRTAGLDPNATVPNISTASPTIPATPVGYGSAYDYDVIESPEDEELPPDLSGSAETPIYREALGRRQTSVARVAGLGIITGLGVLFVLGAIGLFLAVSWYNGIVTKYEAEINALATYTPVFQTVRILDYAGNELTTLGQGGNDRIPVSLDEISEYAIHAVIANENPTFFNDPGWDTGDTIGAFVQSITGGRQTAAQPTITQRVVTELVLRNRPDLQLSDLEFAVVAGEIANRYSKEEILSLFLNEFSFGNQNFGIEAASQFYYQKSAADLTVPEAALLAAIVNDPLNVNPVAARDASFAVMEQVIDEMEALGCLTIPNRGETCVVNVSETAKARVKILPFSPRQTDVPYPHFIDLVRQQLEAEIPDLYSGGYVIKTTLVPAIHDALEGELRNYLERSGIEQYGVTTGAILWTDPTGAIRAYVGSPDYYDEVLRGSQDYARIYKSPGQTFFPFIYAAALLGQDLNGNSSVEFNEYLTAASILWDVPTTILTTSGDYRPVNQYENGTVHGPISLRSALANTYNIAAAKALQMIGADTVARVAGVMGLQFVQTFDARAANGDVRVRMIDLMTAYGTIANDGRHVRVFAIDSITKGGQPIELPGELAHTQTEAIPETIAFLLQNILSDDQARSRSIFPQNNNLLISGRPTQGVIGAVAGSGANNQDLWTFGFTNNAVVGVWLGRQDEGQIQPRVNGYNGAAPLWQRAMDFVLRSGPAPQAFNQPANIGPVPVCPTTGIREGGVCSQSSRVEFFASNRQPAPPEQGLTVQYTVNTWTNQIANESCPNVEDRETRTFVNLNDPDAIAWLRQNPNVATSLGFTANIEAPPTSACDINSITPLASITSPTNGAEVMGEIQILGQVSAADKFSRYELAFAPVGQNNFRLLPGFPINVQQPSPNSQLGTWDTRTVQNGQYQLRLTVIATDGGFVTRTITVNVNNPIPTATPTFTPQPPTPTTFPTFDPGFTPLPFDVTFTPDPF